ncbi:glyoxalase/bleomycin resistance/extradiol dioxygenase family protein [Cohnella sp. OV330]|uniref:VOC family protein n=1 Tax=Cohnella sp. OV330 TaxID=1855288 RepID=UPI0015A5BE15|nr:VOC family protein [Cohnella sp. OV330]
MRVELFVSNLQESAEFYTKVLGFLKEKETERYISVRNGGSIIGLGAMTQLDDNHYLRQATGSERKGVGVEIVLEVNEIENYFRKFQDSDYPIHTGLTKRPWGTTDFRILDPDGYYLRITSRI